MTLEFDEEGHTIVPIGISKEKKYYDKKSISVSIRGEVGYIFDEEGYKKFKEEFAVY